MQQAELPKFSASWWPLRMETIPGSGETLTVAIMVRATSGQASIRQVVQPAVLGALFGTDTAKGVQAMVTTTLIEVQHQLEGGVVAETVELPFGGFSFGEIRGGVARDLNETFDVAVRLTSAFGQSAFGKREEVEESSRRAFEDWAERVQAELSRLTDPLEADNSEIFNVRVKLAQKSVRFGMIHDGYAINFGVLRPTHTSGDLRSLKAKVFDLEALRRDQIFPIDQADVLAGCPSADALSIYSRREVATYRESLEFVESESRARNIAFVRCSSPAEAAEHIRSRLMVA